MEDLFIDIETFSSVDITTSGAYKYIESPDFKILLISYAFGHGAVHTIDLASGEQMHEDFEDALFDENITKHAHNATFERLSFKRAGFNIPIEQWHCTAVKSVYCGLPLSLAEVSKKLDIVHKKLDTGKALIKYFSCTCKPTQLNHFRTRNMPKDSPAKWNEYKIYNVEDVEAEREIHYRLEHYRIPEFERALYIIDQEINDRGILMDLILANNAVEIDEWFSNNLTNKVIEMTGISNPNSPAQLKKWLQDVTGDYTISSLTKETVPILIKQHKDKKEVSFVLNARQKLSKSSVKKYTAMLNCACNDDRARGLFQFHGAGTGRWAGRLIQLQNLPKNHIANLDLARNALLNHDGDTLELLYDDVSTILSQLIRTAFVPKPGSIYHVADFSAIEARVVSWLADEDWRLEVFRGHGKIYEAAAARMFNVPIEMVTKESDLRAKAKNGELALGYQGSLGAMKRMGGEKMGLSDGEMMSIVHKWRSANPKIVALWEDYNNCAINAVMYNSTEVSENHNIIFECDGTSLMVGLPSERKLYYRSPRLKTNKFGSKCVSYFAVDQETKMWGEVDTYGGKLTENIVQALSRDILGYSMLQLKSEGFDTVMHVHDEVICECIAHEDSEEDLTNMCNIMGQEIPWAPGLPLMAEGFSAYYYKKD
jgi:DNA polymerase